MTAPYSPYEHDTETCPLCIETTAQRGFDAWVSERGGSFFGLDRSVPAWRFICPPPSRWSRFKAWVGRLMGDPR